MERSVPPRVARTLQVGGGPPRMDRLQQQSVLETKLLRSEVVCTHPSSQWMTEATSSGPGQSHTFRAHAGNPWRFEQTGLARSSDDPRLMPRGSVADCYQHLLPLVAAAARHALGARNASDEFVHDACVEVVFSLARFRGECALSSWVYAVV